MYYPQTARPHAVLGPPPTSPGYASYANGVPMGPMGLPHPMQPHHHHQSSLSHYPSPPAHQQMIQSSPNAPVLSQHWHQQMIKYESVRSSRSPHHRARANLMTSRNVTKAPIAITNPNKLTEEESHKEENVVNHPSSTVAPISVTNRPAAASPRQNSWLSLDMGGVNLKTLPPSCGLFRFEFLTQLYLNHNALTSVPSELSQLRQLELLDLSGNALTSLPPELGMLSNLKEFWIFDNHLTTLPPEFGFLHQLRTLGIEGNPLESTLKSMVQTSGTTALISYLRDNCPAPPEPPPRQWASLISEQERQALAADPHSETFRILCYNVLCDRAATERLYGYTPSWALRWEYRRRLILEELKRYDCDFLCLQEVDLALYEEHLIPQLEEAGYEGVLWQKNRHKTLSDADRRMVDGCAIFYRTSKYKLVERQMVQFSEIAIQRADFRKTDHIFDRFLHKEQIAVLCLFEHKYSGSRLVVANTHLCWDPNFRDVKLVQTGLLIEQVEKCVARFAKYPPPKRVAEEEVDGESMDLPQSGSSPSSSPSRPLPPSVYRPPPTYSDGSKIPVVVCGDFNSIPESGVYEYLSNGFVSPDHPDFISNQYGRYTSEGIKHRLGLKSAYKGYPGLGYIGPAATKLSSMPNGQLQTNGHESSSYPPMPVPSGGPPTSPSPPTITGGELPMTNYTSSFKGCLDYVWFSTATLAVTKVLGEIEQKYLAKVVGFPNCHFPSDHISIAAEFRVKPPLSPGTQRQGLQQSAPEQLNSSGT